MNLQLETSVPALTVFLQGLLSFFSPCVLPLLPVYISYLSGGAKTVGQDGTVTYRRGIVLRNTIFFVVGVSFAFFALGMGVTAAGRFFSRYSTIFAQIGGIVVILFGLYQLGAFGQAGALSRERRLPIAIDKSAINPLTALLLGFVFSFAWTPCVGPALTSVLLMAGSASSSAAGFLLIGVYTLGFTLPFLAVGLFTSTLLDLFKRHRNVLKYTVKVGGVLMILMGLMMVTGWMNKLTAGLGASLGAASSESSATSRESLPTEDSQGGGSAAGGADVSESADSSETPSGEREPIPAPDFTLTDQNGTEHTLSDYQGKTVFLNFWATWCGPCRSEMPDIQALYEELGENGDEVVILGVAGPSMGREGNVEHIKTFLDENGYAYPVAMDETGEIFEAYGVSAFPTTFMIDVNGNVYGYVPGAIDIEIMRSIIEQTQDAAATAAE